MLTQDLHAAIDLQSEDARVGFDEPTGLKLDGAEEIDCAVHINTGHAAGDAEVVLIGRAAAAGVDFQLEVSVHVEDTINPEETSL